MGENRRFATQCVAVLELRLGMRVENHAEIEREKQMIYKELQSKDEAEK